MLKAKETVIAADEVGRAEGPTGAESVESPLGVLVLDETRRVISADGTFLRRFECAEEAILGRVLDELICPKDLVGEADYFGKLGTYAGDGFLDTVLVLLVGEGRHHCRVRMQSWEGGWTAFVERIDGTPVEELLRLRRHFAAVLKDGADGVALLDTEEVILECNAQFVDLFQLQTEDGVRLLEDAIVGQPFSTVLNDRVVSLLAASLGAKKTRDRRFMGYVHVNGRHLRLTLTPSSDGTGANIGFALVVHDATAEMESIRLAKAVDQASDSVVITDADGVVVYVNPAFEEVSCIDSDDVVGEVLSIFEREEVACDCVEEMWASLHQGRVWAGDCTRSRRDGTAYTEDTRAAPIFDNAGKVTNFVVVGRDVSERRTLEAQLRHAQRLESIGQLAAGIAHEVNTPTQWVGDNTTFLKEAFEDVMGLVNVIQGLTGESAPDAPDGAAVVKTLREAMVAADLEFLADEIPKAIDQSLEGIDRVSTIVRAMKEFSHPGGEDPETVDLNNAIASTITVASSEWRYVSELETDFDPSLPMVPCFPADINQVLLNLIVNAAHAIGDLKAEDPDYRGFIKVSTRQGSDCVEIRVQDNGPGIPTDIQERVFDPFFTTKEVGKGTGQGLSMAQSIVTQKHHGSIAVDSELGKGTTFLICLPLKRSGAEGISGDE